MSDDHSPSSPKPSGESTSDSTVSWASKLPHVEADPPQSNGLPITRNQARGSFEPVDGASESASQDVSSDASSSQESSEKWGQQSTIISQGAATADSHAAHEPSSSSEPSEVAVASTPSLEGSTHAPTTPNLKTPEPKTSNEDDDADGPTVISRGQEAPPAPIDDPTSPDSFAKRLVGAALDHYRLDEFIGGGGMGAVFRAYDALLRRTVAVKILSKGANDQDLLRRFVNEAQSAAKLDHENIARVFFVGRDQGLNYIVFEFVEGKNLRQLVTEEGVLPFGLSLRYMCQLARALEHAAARQVIHRDIKPSNVVITPDHRVKLVDMGLARIHHLDSQQAELTASDMTLGTFDYISPEQARDPRVADTRSDLYSLGCTFYFMLTGSPPFPDGTALQKVLAHGESLRPDPRSLRPETPASISRIIQRLMASNPDQRFQTPNELLAELLVAATELNIDVGLNESYIIETSVDRRDWIDRLVPWVVSGGALALIIGLIEFAMPPALAINEATPQYRSTAATSVPSTAITPGSGASPSTAISNPATSPPVTPSTAITQIRVGQATTAPGILVVGTWAQALAQLEINPQVTDVQLWFNGFVDIEPFSIKSPVMHITAGDGFRPGVRFKTANDNTSSAPLVRLFGGDFEWKGIDIDWHIEPGTEVTPGSLFRIEQNYAQTFPELTQKTLGESPYQEFSFTDSRVTLGNLATDVPTPNPTTPPTVVATTPSSSGAAATPSTMPSTVPPPTFLASPESGPALIEVVRPESFLLTLADGEIAHFPRILVRRVMLRGQSRVLKAVPGTPFQLQCEQCLLISPLAAIRLGGIRSDALIPGDKLKAEVEFRQVTALGGGVLDVQPGDASPVVMPLDLRTVDCWFTLEADKPLVRYRLTASDNKDHLRWSGSDNVMSTGSLLWSSTLAGGMAQTLTLQSSFAKTPLEGLAAIEPLAALPESVARVLRGDLPRERFDVPELEAAITQISTGTARRLGVAPRDLPAAPAALRPTTEPR